MEKDKQIIIDGCNVSGCSELYNGCLCDDGSFYCKDQPNCKFKLEQRGYTIEQITEFTPKKELQETITHLRVLNAELQSYNEQLKESQNVEIKENRILREQLKRKEQECETLKAELEQETALKETYLACYKAKHEDIEGELFNLRQYKASKQASYEQLQKRCNELELENRKLKAENDELKEEIAKVRMEICNECGERTDYNIPCKQIRDLDYGLQLEIEENYKLKQTLIEIKEIAVDQKDVLESMRIDIAEQILNKISEVLDEE